MTAPQAGSGASTSLTVAAFANLPQDGKEYAGAVYAELSEPKRWAPAGYTVARDQFLLQPGRPRKDAIEPSRIVAVETPRPASPDVFRLQTPGGDSFEFDSRNGALVAWPRAGVDLLALPLEPYFQRPTNRNQAANYYERRLGVRKIAAQERELSA